jgi:hypothetical protein
MTIQTCVAGRSIPIRNLIQKILISRGHLIGEAPNPARCVDWYTNGSNKKCTLLVVDYTGPETMDMIDILVDRKHIRPENIAVFANGNSKCAAEVKDRGCFLLTYPFRMENLITWAMTSEKRCQMNTRSPGK